MNCHFQLIQLHLFLNVEYSDYIGFKHSSTQSSGSSNFSVIWLFKQDNVWKSLNARV